MQSQTHIVPGVPESKIEVTWVRNQKEFQVFYNCEKVGQTIKSDKDLRKRVDFITSDGHIIGLQFFKSMMSPFNSVIEVSWDGVLLPDSLTQDHQRYKDASGCSGILVLVGFIYGFLSLSASRGNVIWTFMGAVVLLFLWLFIKKGSLLALIIFTVIYGLDAISFVFSIFSMDNSGMLIAVLYGIVVRSVAFIILIRGSLAIIRQKKINMGIKGFINH